MKFHRQPAPSLLIFLPLLVSALSAGTDDETLIARDAKIESDSAAVYAPDAIRARDVGTKDAPVDGKDGKPHDGPYVVGEDDKVSKPVSSTGESALGEEKSSELVLADGTKLPPTDEGGVMDDPKRTPPKKGTTGTEGGVSEKDKTRKHKEDASVKKPGSVPSSPKETPLAKSGSKPKDQALPKSGNGQADKIPDAEDLEKGYAEALAGLEKPKDLPEKIGQAKNPIPKSANKDHLDVTDTSRLTPPKFDEGSSNDGLIQPLHSYMLSLTMILVSEIGDKTFLIAALMAMKHPRLLVFSAAFAALIAMTILSAVLGHAVPTLIPKRLTNYMAAGLFLVFGARMLREGLAMDPNEGVAAEMQEVEQELAEKEILAQQGGRRSSISPYNLELGLAGGTRKSRSGSRLPKIQRSPSTSPERSPSPPRRNLQGTVSGLTNLMSLLLSPAWVQTFVMTFLGEWGDRSQIATIAMAAGQDYWWVTGGAVSGHAVCTGVAVIGGRAIAGKVSLRVVTLGGAVAFLIFGLIYLIEAMYYA